MRPLTVLAGGVSAQTAFAASDALREAARVVVDVEADPLPALPSENGGISGQTGLSWRSVGGGPQVVVRSVPDEMVVRIRVGDGADAVDADLEMPRSLTPLTDRLALRRLLDGLSRRLAAAVPCDGRRAERQLSRLRILCELMAAEAGELAAPFGMAVPSVRIPSPSPLGEGGMPVVAHGSTRSVLPTPAFARLLSARVASTVRVAVVGGRLRLSSEAQWVSAERLDAMSRLRLLRSAGGMVPAGLPLAMLL